MKLNIVLVVDKISFYISLQFNIKLSQFDERHFTYTMLEVRQTETAAIKIQYSGVSTFCLNVYKNVKKFQILTGLNDKTYIIKMRAVSAL